MLSIFSDTFRTATRTDSMTNGRVRSHWPASERFDTRAGAELEAHRVARRRV